MLKQLIKPRPAQEKSFPRQDLEGFSLFTGEVERCYQIASGTGIYQPYDGSTLKLQMPHFRAAGFDLGEQVPGFFLGTININLGNRQLRLKNPDKTLEGIEWTDKIPPESFSFVRCTMAYKGYYFSGLIYYPHPETKPKVNAHHFNRLEVLAMPVPGLKYGDQVSVLCRADAFEEFR